MRPMFGAFGKAGSSNSIAFVSKVQTLCSLMRTCSDTHMHRDYSDNFSFVFFPCILLPVFISQAALYSGVKELYGLNKRVEAVSNVRKLSKLDMKLNDALPSITVDPETYTVIADGEVLTCPAASTVPLSRNYFLF